MSDTTRRLPQIVAVGGKMLMPNSAHKLERYVLEASGIERPKVCFLATATGDDASYINRFYDTYTALDARPTHLPLFARTPADLATYLLDFDVIHVGGGNTRSMIAVWRHWGIDVILRDAWQQGTVLTGSSAGMLCWFASGVTDSIAGPLSTTHGLGFISTSACPHFDGERERRPAYHAMIAGGELPAGYAADDGAGLHFIGNALHASVALEAKAKTYFIECVAGKAVENELPISLL